MEVRHDLGPRVAAVTARTEGGMVVVVRLRRRCPETQGEDPVPKSMSMTVDLKPSPC